jgi:hypothetical protein
MSRTRTLSTALLVGLLVSVLLSLPGDGERVAAAVEPRLTTARIMVPAAAFIPAASWMNYTGGDFLMTSDTASFFAPIAFPVPVVNIQGITVYATDMEADDSVCVYLYRSSPIHGREGIRFQGQACTTDSSVDPQAVSNLRRIYPTLVNTAVHGSYLWASVTGGSFMYGVQVTYSYQTTP